MIDLGALAGLLLGVLGDGSGQLVGDGVAPEGGGWLSGQPNVSAFVPYGVLASTGAVLADPALRYGDQVRSWDASWRLSSFGGSRSQCDWVATRLRLAAAGCIGVRFGDFRVSMLSWRSLGAMVRSDAVDPPMWSVVDAFSVRADS